MTVALTIAQVLEQYPKDLTSSPTPQLDCEILLTHCLKVSKSYLYTWPERILNTEQILNFLSVVERRKQGEPIAYITGHKEFWSMDFMVSPEVLIPRPETELLIEVALQLLPKNQISQIVDLGTGSGVIAISVGKERPQTHVLAIDDSEAALAIASKNAHSLGVENITFQRASWFSAQEKSSPLFNLILSNPPYIAENDPHLQTGDLRYEPQHALIGGKTGLEGIFRIIEESFSYLSPQGYIIIEHGFDQATDIRSHFSALDYQHIRTYRDLSGHNRITLAQHP